MKKILLLTDMPPCENFTAGLVLDKLVRFLPSDRIAICAIVNKSLKPKIPDDLQDIPRLILKKPFEGTGRILPRLIGGIFSFILEILQSLRVKYLLLPKILNFIKEQKIDVLWVVLQGQTTIRLALYLTEKTELPLFTQVWDPFEWWLRANKIDRFTRKRLLNIFDKVIEKSVSCATASWAMSKRYSELYGVKNLPVIASLSGELARKPAKRIHSREEFIIGMAGQFYAQEEWLCLIKALESVNWKILGKNIRLRVLGGQFQHFTQSPANFEYLGWNSQEDTISLLADADLLYMPYWFSEEFRLESMNSFPSKLVTYFVTGRPVLCHAPEYSSPAKYIIQNNAGYICNSLDTQSLLRTLEIVINDSGLYAEIAQNGTKCFFKDFTLERMRNSFFKFLLADENEEN